MLRTVQYDDLDLSKRQIVSVRLTPSEAAELMKYNIDNRRMRVGLVKYLIAQIKQHEWRDDHPQPIVFSDSRLIDGQHRLTAIAQSGYESGCVVRVETQADDAVRQYLDTGAVRSLADRVQVVEDRSFNEWIMRCVNTRADLHGTGGSVKIRPTPEDAREFYDCHKLAMTSVYAVWHKVPQISIIPVAVAAIECVERDSEKGVAFYADYFTPAGKIKQAQLLRDAILRTSGSARGSYMRKEVYQKAVACMKAYLEGREIKRVVCGTW